MRAGALTNVRPIEGGLLRNAVPDGTGRIFIIRASMYNAYLVSHYLAESFHLCINVTQRHRYPGQWKLPLL